MDGIPEMSSSPPISSLSECEPLLDRQVYAAERARLLFGFYKRGEANDPETFVMGVSAILSDYPMETIRWVTDPRTGMPSNPWKDPKTGYVKTGLPEPFDVKTACEAHYGPLRRRLQMLENARKQLEEREAVLRLADYSPRAATVSYGQYMQMTGGKGRPIGRFERAADVTKPTLDPEAVKKAHNVSDEVWNSFPDQGDRLDLGGTWKKPG